MKRFTDIFLVVDFKSLLIIALAVASTWGSIQLGLIAEFELALSGTAIVFPIVFSIGQAYKRREDALTQYGCLKAHGRATPTAWSTRAITIRTPGKRPNLNALVPRSRRQW